MKNLLLIHLIALIITPSAISQSRTHTLKAGETLYSLSRRYGVSLTTLLETNNISDASILPQGITLIIPSPVQDTLLVTSTTIASSTRTSNNTATYYAKKGDTYYSIARNHGMKVDELLKLSNKSSNSSLLIGDRLVIFKQPGTSMAPSNSAQPIENRAPQSAITVSPALITSNNTQQPMAQPNQSIGQKSITPPRARPSELAVIDGVTWPVNGVISAHNGRQRGVSIAINGEQSIKALSRGTVVYKGSYRELGQIVVVEHAGGYTYLYSGFDNAYVKIGDSVEAGTSLGKVSVNSNIIFSVFKDGNPINPKIAPRD